MAALVFLDTETTGLSLADDIWEFAAIRREADGTQTECHMFIRHDPAKRAAMPDRFRDDLTSRYFDAEAYSPDAASGIIAGLFDDDRSTHVVGAVPNFDTERLALLLRRYGLTPTWHHHLIDVEALTVGYLASQAREYPGSKAADVLRIGLPWRSDDITAAIGVTVPEDERHTAMGDARWAMRTYDAVMGGVL